MKFEWKVMRADEFCTFVTDGTHDSPKAQATGRKLITSKHLKGYYIDFDSANWISEEDYNKIIARSSVEQWDILYSMIGTIGTTYLEKNPVVNYACKNMGIFKFSGRCDDAYWMYYYLKSPQSNEYIHSHLRGSTQAYVPLGTLRAMPVVVPEKAIRKKIVSILKSIDDRIELNNKINDNLEQQARLTLNWWMVEHSGEYESLPLSDIATVNDNIYSPKEKWHFINYLDTSSITDGTIAELQHIVPTIDKLPSRARRKIIANDVVFSTVRPNQHHFGIIKQPVPNMLASTGFAVIRSKTKEICNELIYLRLTEDSFIESMQQIAEQSTSTFPSIKPSDLYQCEIPCPLDDKLTILLENVFSIIAINQKENLGLSQLRDALLPKLMNGEIEIY